ncbi:hypothetical protein OsJ_18890 [Oryza sativa Japonica Group]|uniref:Uncharacterized protein n=1 Tax=Oryza sativa subsp. japonica TaxID=39947 RepID=B9FKQ3_ORYSJ|nr:hypothetical protein OsJ_18890 [Oryza sativa Japonica Group]
MAFDLKLTACLLLAVFSLAAAADCECQPSDEGHDAAKSRTLKVIAIFCILVGSSAGCAIPSLGRRFPALRPDTSLFFALKAFAAGVILATAFVQILPVSFDKLGSPCLVDGPWRKYPRAQDSRGAVAAVAACGGDASSSHDHERGNAHGVSSAVIASATMPNDAADDCDDAEDRAKLVRHRVISQVFELGIIVHSIIIGISLGASESPSTIRPLVAALTFHQFFEGIGLGGCIVQIISLQNTILRMFHKEAEEPADDEGAAGKKQGMARDSDEVSPGCRGADGRCSRRWKEARNRALSRRIRHDGEKPVDGARAGGRKRVIARGGERFRGGFAEMPGSRRLASAGRHSHFAAMHAGGDSCSERCHIGIRIVLFLNGIPARFHLKSAVTMAIFFSLTTPVGIMIGIGISSAYNENSPTALIVEGILDAAAAGILNYMALVDLLAEDFMNPRVRKSGRLQLIISILLLVGIALMSLLGIWA